MLNLIFVKASKLGLLADLSIFNVKLDYTVLYLPSHIYDFLK